MITIKKQFSSSLDEQLLDNFKKECSNYGVAMNTILEALIQDFCKGNYAITISKQGTTIKRED